MAPTAHLVIRKDYMTKNGEYYIHLRIKINKQKKEFPTGIKIKDLTKFDERTGRLKGNIRESLILENALDKAEQILFKFRIENKLITLDQFKQLYLNRDSLDSFYAFAEQEIKNMAGIVSYEYYRQFKSEMSKLKKYRKEISWNELNLDFIEGYERYMKITLNNKVNTVSKTMKKIKKLCSVAVRKNLLKESPFTYYRIKSEPTGRLFLTENELKFLMELFSSGSLSFYLQNTLKYFLFSCYTGLRFEDIKQLKYENIRDGQVYIKMHKTKHSISIPLSSYAKKLIKSGLPDENVFHVNSNQKTNAYLKKVVEMAGINKSISFHCARHTFATLGLSFGIDLYTIKEMLGHTDLKTTQIYAKLLNEQKIKGMNFWEDKL